MRWMDLDLICDAQPLYFLGGSILVLAFLLLVLIVVIAWPMNSRVRISRERDRDVMAQPLGDQPRVMR